MDEPFFGVGAGAATLITDDPRFVMLKPTVIYTIVGLVMLKPGWMNRYLPAVAIEVVPDIAFIFGFICLNLIVALNFSVVTWAAFMSIYGVVSKLALFLIGFVTMRTIGGRRRAKMIVATQS